MTNTRSLVESSLLAGLAVMLFLASHFLPVIGVAFSFLCPAPLVILGLRHNTGHAFAGLLAASILVLMILGPVGALFFVLGFGVLGVGLGYLAKTNESAVEIMMYGILVSLGSKLLLMVIASKLTGINPFSLEPAEMNEIIDKVFGFYSSTGMAGENLEEARAQIKQTLRIIPLVFPAILTMASAVDCYLSYVVSRVVLRRTSSISLPALPGFDHWRFPKNIFWALLVSILLSFAGMSGQEWNMLAKVGTNLRLIINMLFLIQGMSLCWYFLKSRGINRILGVVVLVFMILVPIISQIVILLGIIDLWFDLRSRKRRSR